MNKCSVLFVLLAVVSPIFADKNAQQRNFGIVDSYCAPNTGNSKIYQIDIIDTVFKLFGLPFATPQVFQSLCPALQGNQCCKYLIDQIRANPDWHLCAVNRYSYQFFLDGCPSQLSRVSYIEPNRVRRTDPVIYFPTEQFTQRLAQTTASPYNAQRMQVNTYGAAPQYNINMKTPTTPTTTARPYYAQQGMQVFQFGGDPQYNVLVNAQTTPDVRNQRPRQPAAQQAQNYFNSATDDGDDDRPVPIFNSRGFQASNFALNLFKNLDRPANGDAVISPLLPQQLLSNLVDYASPKARQELQNTVQLDAQQLSDMTKTLDKVSKSTVNTIETAAANFVASDLKLNNTYRSDVQLRNVDVLPVDFDQPAQAARTANKWVSDKTHRLINEVLNPGAINPYTRLLLANTIYFKGKWKYAFIETNPGTFESSPNNPRQLNKMFQLNKLRYGELSFPDGNGLRWVELPYEGENVAMLVFLPTQRHQLEASLQQLRAEDLARVMADLQAPYINTKVHLRMPKFTLTDTSSLIPALKRMGLHSIFHDADALKYLTHESTVVSDVTQRSYMSVDEFGTKATSVASLSIITLSVTPQYKDVRFDVDEPFLVMVVDKQERYPFFIGQIYDPRE